MAKLGNPKNTIEILNKYEFSMQKKFGQNFLIDTHVLEKIVRAADITKDDFILEIGPGIGTLTQYLCEHGKQVLAIEIDKKLMPVLDETLADYENVEVINEDVLKLDLKKLIEERNGSGKVKVVANLPYYITTPIIMGLFESNLPIENITVMVQKEVADRIQSGPGTKDYGSISVAVQYYAKPYIAAFVPPNCFMPRPKVGSAVLCLTPHTSPPVYVKDEKLFFQIIRAAFNQRRKTLVNGIYNAGFLKLSKEEITDAIIKIDKPANIRGEALTLEEFAKLSNALSEND
ncbi:MAG: 16S rRNA (adenine(1518)-N(6)/adenine(1519)-N(6))-dimethyltransferase RsmA [Clostridiales bacterium]|nr:16S rRNA (adenine(1518)-N(6)/adenine(1519)-N(6))-dimethyltransferase RsmA [Clostridiales bacterium]